MLCTSLWRFVALHRPAELNLTSSASANLDQLMAIARISHKYGFRSTENWGLDAIQEYINRKPIPILPSPLIPSHKPEAENTEQLTILIRAHVWTYPQDRSHSTIPRFQYDSTTPISENEPESISLTS